MALYPTDFSVNTLRHVAHVPAHGFGNVTAPFSTLLLHRRLARLLKEENHYQSPVHIV